MTRDELLRNTLDRLDEICPKGLYTYMQDHLPELNREFCIIEQRVDECFHLYKNIDELKAALRDYWDVHMRAAGEMGKVSHKS